VEIKRGDKKIRKSEGEAIQVDQDLNRSLIQDNIQIVPYRYPPFRLPQGGWLISLFQELKFSGRETDLNRSVS